MRYSEIILALSLLCSCSVKEERSCCPCSLMLVMSECGQKKVEVSAWNGGCLFSEYLSQNGYPLVKDVPRGEIVITALCGLSSCFISGTEILVPEGSEMDELLTYRNELYAEGDVVVDTVFLTKNYASVIISLVNGSGEKYDLSVHSDTRGFDYLNGKPVAGDFLFTLLAQSDGNYCTRIPRQGGARLEIELTPDGEKPISFDIGDYLKRSGYDWSSKVLDDIYVRVDCTSARIYVSVNDWNENSYEEII